MKKTLFLFLLVISNFVVAYGNLSEDKKGRIAIKKNLSEEGKVGYIKGVEAAKKNAGYVLSEKKSEQYESGFSLGYFHGLQIMREEKPVNR